MLGVGPARQRGRAHAVPALHVRRRAAARVARDAAARLAGLRVEGDGDVGLRGRGEVDGVGVGDLAARDGDGGGAVVEGEGFEGGGVDAGHAGLVALRERDGGRGDGQVAGAEGVADLEAEALCAEGDVEGLAEGGVAEDAAAAVLWVGRGLEESFFLCLFLFERLWDL